MGMGMVLWEWEGMGTEIVLPAHLYYYTTTTRLRYPVRRYWVTSLLDLTFDLRNHFTFWLK